MISGEDLVWSQKKAMGYPRKKGNFPSFFVLVPFHVFIFFSSWLHQMRNRSNRFSRGVWIMAILILLLIAGGVAIGLFMRRNAPSHQQPKAFGGSADSLATSTSVAPTTAPPGRPSPTSSSSLHVSPTLTLKNREESTPSAVPSKHRRMHVGHRFN